MRLLFGHFLLTANQVRGPTKKKIIFKVGITLFFCWQINFENPSVQKEVLEVELGLMLGLLKTTKGTLMAPVSERSKF